MLSLVIKNFILSALIALIMHFLIKNHMLEKTEKFETNQTPVRKSNFKTEKNVHAMNTVDSSLLPRKKVQFKEDIESFDNYDDGDKYDKYENYDIDDIDNNKRKKDSNISDNTITIKDDFKDSEKIKDELYEYVFDKTSDFNDAPLELQQSEKEEPIKEFNNIGSIADKSDEIFNGIVGYSSQDNFSSL